MATLESIKSRVQNSSASLNEKKYKAVTNTISADRNKINLATVSYELRDSDAENDQIAVGIKRTPIVKNKSNDYLDQPYGAKFGSSSSKKKDRTNIAASTVCSTRHKPGAVFAEISNVKSGNFNRKSLEEHALTPKLHNLKNLNSSHPPLIQSQTSLLTPNTFGKTFQRSNLQGTTPITTPKGISKSSKSTPLESTAKRMSSVKKTLSALNSRMSTESSFQDKIEKNVKIVVSEETPARKSYGYQNVRSNLRRVSSARKSASSYQNSPSSYQNSPSLIIPSYSNTPVSTSSHGLPSFGSWVLYGKIGQMREEYMSGSNGVQSGVNDNGERLRELCPLCVEREGTPSETQNTPRYDPTLEWDLDPSKEESSTVSVGIRVRPINSREIKKHNIRNIIEIRANEIYVTCENGTIHSFTYDHCLWSCDKDHANYASQEFVYQEMAQPLLDHAYEGYNVCLFAYGQTGSGKSYCIMGEDNDYAIDPRGIPQEAGIIPRFCQDLFLRADKIHSNNETQDVKRRVIIEISYIEIYNERIYDLVGCQCAMQGEEGEKNHNCHYHGGDKREALRVREHPDTGPFVVGASCHLVTTYQDLLTWITLGNKQRSIAATGMNDKSSRSHSVFSIKLTQIQKVIVGDQEMEHSLVSSINLVDLAGSERVAATQMDGDRLKEGVSINKSLLTLGKVITALAENAGKRKSFITYRDSVLTWVLKESLGGNSKTAMIATISPCNIYQEETLSTLRFACQAQKIVNWNHINEDPTSKIIRSLKLEVERLRAQQCGSPTSVLPNEHIYSDFEIKISKCTDVEAPNGELKSKVSKQLQNEELEQLRIKEKKEAESKQRRITILEEKLKITQEQFVEKENQWKEKYQESELKRKEALERCKAKGIILKVEDKKPTLVNLCEDSQLSEILLYSLRKGSTTLGQTNSDVTLSGLHSKDVHCSISFEGEKLVLHPESTTETYLNGKLVTKEIEVFHNDRIVLGGIYYFRVCYPSNVDPLSNADKQKLDFFFARDEILKAQEERLNKELSLQLEATKAEMLLELDEHRNQFNLEKNAMNDNINVLSAELEVERKQRNETELAKLNLEEEKQFLENRMQQFQRRTSLLSESSSPLVENHFLDQMESIFNESVQIIESSSIQVKPQDVETHFMIIDANLICKQLKKQFVFQQQNQLTTLGLEPAVVVFDLEHDMSASIPIDQFKNILNILRDLVSGYREDDNLFETAILWERNDEMTKLPGVVSQIKTNSKRLSLNATCNSPNGKSLNISLNGSIMGPPQMTRKLTPRRRSVLNQSSKKNTSFAIIPTVSCSGRCIAKALSQVLLNQNSVEHRVPPFSNAISSLINLQNDVKVILKHFQQPTILLMESEDLIGPDIIRLGMATQNMTSALQNIASLPFSKICDDNDLHGPIDSLCMKMMRKVTRMLKGIEKEVDSLIEEEGSELLLLINEAIENVAFLIVLSSESLMQTSLFTGMETSSNFIAGVVKGIECQVKNAAQIAKSVSLRLKESNSEVQDIIENQQVLFVRKEALNAISKIAAFLDQFSLLKVSDSLTPNMKSTSSTEETDLFLHRVESASDSIFQLTTAIKSVMEELKILHNENFDICNITNSVSNLHESLSQIIEDAGVDSALQRGMKSQHSDTRTKVEGIDSHLEKLAWKSMKSVQTLRWTLSDFDATRQKSVKSFLKLDGLNNPLKSSFKSGLRSLEEKKVRFNVSLLSNFSECAEDESFQDINTETLES